MKIIWKTAGIIKTQNYKNISLLVFVGGGSHFNHKKKKEIYFIIALADCLAITLCLQQEEEQ